MNGGFGEKRNKRVIWELGGELENHTFQSPCFFFCAVYKEKPPEGREIMTVYKLTV